ncbi:Predicted protease with the C-terminal PDZ domain [Burkholderia pseudomallei]|nr:Predicted protease with the C-terminal PDZ domain [Burkholderia pseudomallei]CAJ4729749.1 Predicted protease with the C-terminal PDZ domain [Burkholderia pseudomallei]CAJ7344430.1 Predicted protease with the C-terminal PDZ domain [Burkholderia pseudomallei]
MSKTVFAISTATAVLTGCSMARGVHEDLAPAALVTGSVNTTGHVDLYRDGQLPQRPIIRIAKVAAHGNSYATKETLEATLVDEALKLNADCVIIAGANVTDDGTIGSYGGHIFSSAVIRKPHLYGIACKYSKVRLGIVPNKDGVVSYVATGSAAEKAGIVEGDKLVAINGIPVVGNPFIIDTQVASKNPGDQVTLEILDHDGHKQRKVFTLPALTSAQ